MRDSTLLALTTGAAAAATLLYMARVIRVRCGSIDSDMMLPFCQLLAEAVRATDASLFRVLEGARFRSVEIVVFDAGGDVWADSQAPVHGKTPQPPSDGQRALFRALAEAGVKEGPVRVNMFRPRHPASGSLLRSNVCGAPVKDKPYILCTCATGYEHV